MGQIELATTVWPAGLRGESLTTLTAETLIDSRGFMCEHALGVRTFAHTQCRPIT